MAFQVKGICKCHAKDTLNDLSLTLQCSQLTSQMEMNGPCSNCVFPVERSDAYSTRHITTPLMLAARNGHEQCVNAWIEAGADVNVADTAKNTALMQAVVHNSKACLDPLIKAGTDVNESESIYNSPLMLAAQLGHTECLTTLLAAGADVNLKRENGDTALIATVLIDHSAVCNTFDENNATEQHGHYKCMELLIEAGADVNTYNDECQTALTLASWHGYTEGVDILIKAGADVNKEGGRGDKHSPLLFACKGGYIKSVESLLEAGADVNMASQYGYTALFIDTYATYPYQYKECVIAVLRAGIQINKVNFLHRNALAEVLEHEHKKGARLLFAIGETLDDKVPKRLIPDCLNFDDLQLELKHICREAIRKHLLELDPHSNLFGRIPRLGLPEVLNQYLLYGVSLDDEEDKEDEDDDEEEEEDKYGYVIYNDDDDDDNDDADDYGCDDDYHDDDN